jgi:hypothetical protein
VGTRVTVGVCDGKGFTVGTIVGLRLRLLVESVLSFRLGMCNDQEVWIPLRPLVVLFVNS